MARLRVVGAVIRSEVFVVAQPRKTSVIPRARVL